MAGTASVEYSVSTWFQAVPPVPGPVRGAVLDQIVAMIDVLGGHRLRVAIDGFTASGKTSLGHELARGLALRGRPVFRASLDDFKRPWSDRHLYDRESGEGYYRNAFDSEATYRLLLEPSGASADGNVALCSIDPLTQIDHSAIRSSMPENGILVVDGVFALRPEFNDYWDFRIWIDIDPELSVTRGVGRDAGVVGDVEGAEKLHRDRYLVGELLYIAEVSPRAFVDVIVDNTDIAQPRLLA